MEKWEGVCGVEAEGGKGETGRGVAEAEAVGARWFTNFSCLKRISLKEKRYQERSKSVSSSNHTTCSMTPPRSARTTKPQTVPEKEPELSKVNCPEVPTSDWAIWGQRMAPEEEDAWGSPGYEVAEKEE